MSYTYQFPRPALTVDCLVFAYHEQKIKILLIQRKKPPFKGNWALPGGFVEIDEPLETAAKRELQEETGLTVEEISQLYTFGAPDRDPRGRAISVAYTSCVPAEAIHLSRPASDAVDTGWFPIRELPELAFDHQDIFDKALERWQFLVRHQPFGKDFLPTRFRQTDLDNIFEEILGRKLKSSPINTLKKYEILQIDKDGWISFNTHKYHETLKTGFLLSI